MMWEQSVEIFSAHEALVSRHACTNAQIPPFALLSDISVSCICTDGTAAGEHEEPGHRQSPQNCCVPSREGGPGGVQISVQDQSCSLVSCRMVSSQADCHCVLPDSRYT